MAKLPEFKNLIGGEMRAASSGKTLDQINPVNGQVWARIPASDKTDVDDAVAAAVRAFPMWSGLPAAARAHYLRQVGQIFIKHAEEFGELELQGIGTIPFVGGRSIMAGLSFKWEQAAGDTLAAVTGRAVQLEPGKLGYTLREPYGVVAAIIPFNGPLPIAVLKAAPALAAGNTVVMKPPELCSPSILRFGELVKEVLPPGVFNIVSGLGPDVGDHLTRHPAVRRITMTGSVGTARNIQRAAADNLTSSIFELGGKSANIVFADADLDKATYGVTVGGIFTNNAGQACVGGSRILVQRSILDEMLKRIEAAAKKIVVGDPRDPAISMGPLISKAQYDKVVKFLEEGKRDCKLVFGGRHGPGLVPSLPGGFWVEPTLFLTENNALRICQEEIFGPVAMVIPFDTDDQAVAIANDTRFGLAAGFWTKDQARTNRMVRDLKAGTVWVNTYLEFRYELPFEGIKESGYGHDDILEFTREKSAIIQTA
jgi:aldehyde dehydrogenase (NAD+)